MKKNQLFSGILLALLVFQFTACNNEPVLGNGEFPDQSDPNVALEGQFKAQIDGVEFIASVAEATLTSENVLRVVGTNVLTGEIISLTSEAVLGAETYNLVSGGLSQNEGAYELGDTGAYTTNGTIGGSGQLIISELNTTDLTVSGTFSINGKRVQLDANGDPVLDGNGDPIIETVTISLGVFNTIPYVLDDTGGGGSGGGGGGPIDEFHALVDGDEFLDSTITTTLTTIGDVEMINIIATTASNAKIRIDLPLYLGEGTFAMEALSDGTKVIALYNGNTGGENLTSNPGTITISEYDTEEGLIIATFNFTGSDPINVDPTVVEVTEGSFTVNFEGIPGSGPSPFTAEVDNVLFEPTQVDVQVTLFNGTEIVNINATGSDSKSMSLVFPKDITIGSYNMSAIVVDGSEKIGVYNPDTVAGTTLFKSNPGILIITSYDIVTGEIEGTFSFTAKDSSGIDPAEYEITNGSFSITLL